MRREDTRIGDTSSEPEEGGVVFNVQGYSIHDGPGIRTVVFLKGCPLRCLWCCNPESRSSEPEVEYSPLDCIKCGRCVAACPKGAISADLSAGAEAKIDRARCDACRSQGFEMACVTACPSGALRAVGKWQSVDEVLLQALRDLPFYRRSGGGVTLSGGEPLRQWRFARSIARACQEKNVSVALETTGAAPWSSFEATLEYTDLVLYDLKETDSARHRALTGVGNELILDNLRRVAERGAPFILRLPLVPGLNLTDEHLLAAGRLAAELGAREVNLMPFHQLGKEKYRRMGLGYSLGALPGLRDTPDGLAALERARLLVAGFGLTVTVGG